MTDDSTGTGSRLPDISRRGLLGGAGIAAAVLAIPGAAEAAIRSVAASTRARPSVSFTLRDRESMQRLEFSFFNVQLNSAGTRFVPSSSSATAIMVVDLGPQALIEQIVTGTRPRTPVSARLALPSRLAFDMPSKVGISADREGLLNWLQLSPRVTTLGAYPAGDSIPVKDVDFGDPSVPQTSIEIPWFMVVSPSDESTWEHDSDAVTKNGRTELWRTRLATQTSSGADHSSDTVRVVWLRDRRAADMLDKNPSGIVNKVGKPDYPFRMRPNPQDRSDIGRLTAMTTTSTGRVRKGGRADPVTVDLRLSSLGGTMSAEGTWNQPWSSLTSWQQRTWNGRDTYIRTTRRGFLYPFGVPAVLQTEVIREFAPDRGRTTRAFEREETRILITDPSIDLDGATGVPYDGRGTPFSSLRYLTLASPPITGEDQPLGGQWNGLNVFVPLLDSGEPFSFTLVGVDRRGQRITMQIPGLFAEDEADSRGNRANFTASGARALRNYYDGLDVDFRRADLRGQYVGFAPGDDGSTALPTINIDFSLDSGDNASRPSERDLIDERRPWNFPRLQSANVNIDGVSAMAGNNQNVSVEFPDVYLDSGIGGSDLGIFLQGIGAQGVGVDVQRGGGISAPQMGLAGIGSISGVLPGAPGDLPSISGSLPQLRPADMLGELKLFGGISLADLLPDRIDMLQPDPTDPSKFIPNPKAPAFDTNRSFDIDLPDIPLEVEVTYTWRPDLEFNSAAGALLEKLLPELDQADFYVTVTAKASAYTQEAYWRAEGALTNLLINFIGDKTFASVRLERFGFTAGSDRAQDLQVEIGDVVFGDALAFLSNMARFLSFGSGSGPILNIDARSITTGFNLAVPEINLGAVALTGLNTQVAINLPFGADPVRFSLAFSSQDDPFAVVIMGIGGGGWFGMDLGLEGVEYLNIGAAIKASLEIDLGVASGGVSCTIGMQYEITGRGDAAVIELTAFVCVKGRVEVLGIVSISIEICVGLTAQLPAPGERIKLTGKATCTVKVKVCGVKKTVKIQMKRSVTGGVMPEIPGVSSSSTRSRAIEAAADEIEPITFADVMTQADWDEWCGAFA